MIPLFLHNLEWVFGWLLAASWQASVLALIVLAVQAVLRGRLNPRWRYALWLLVVLRLVMPTLPESALSLFQFAPTPAPVLLTPVTGPLFAPVTPTSPEIAPLPLAEPPGRPLTLDALLALGWLAGVLVLLGLTWEVNRRFARQVAQAPAITDPALLDLFFAAKAELGVRRTIRLVESGQVQSPAIMGLFSPTLLLPGGVRDRFDATELRLIFLHELAHLKRGDVIVQGLIALLQILHWFNPVLGFAFRRMRIDREPATDALVLSRAGEAEKERYGLMLIKLLEHFNQRHSLPTLVGILEDKDQFKRRFFLIAKFTRGAYGWSVLGVLLIGILAVVCLTKSKSTVSPNGALASAKLASERAKPNGEQLIDAAGREDIPEMTRLLNLGTDVNYREKDGWTPITKAVESNKAGSVKFLLAHGADTAHGINDKPLLFDAQSPEVAEILIQHGVDVKARSKSGQTALDEVGIFKKKPAEIARVLLKHGADPNARDNYGETPLTFAPDGATVDVLVEYGADIKAKNKNGLGVLYNPRGDAGRLQALLRHGAPFDPKTDGPTLMMEAAWFDHVDVIAYLLSLGVDPNLKGTWNAEANMYFTPLQESVISGHFDAAKFLLEHGVKFEPRIINGKPGPDEMDNALYNRRTTIVKLFWEHGVRSISELTYVISQGEPIGAVQKLLDGGIPPDPSQDKFISPLTLAAELGRLDVVALLVQRGAKINGHVAPDESPIDQAAMEGQDEVMDYLLHQGAQVDYQALWNAVWDSYPGPDQRSKDHFERTVKLLLDAGTLKITTPEQNGRILVGAIETRDPGGNFTVLKMLLDAGLSPESPMPYLAKNGENPNSVIGYYRDLHTRHQDDNGAVNNMKALLDMLEAADKGSTPKTATGTNTTNTGSSQPPPLPDLSALGGLSPQNEAIPHPTLNVPKLTFSLPMTLPLNGRGTIISHPYSPVNITPPNLPPPPNPNNTYTYHSSVTIVTVSGPVATPDKSANAVGNPALAQALVAVAKQGDLAEVERLLKQGAKAGGNDVLAVAAAKNQKLVQLLRQYNALPISDLAWAVLENRPTDEILEIEEKEVKEKMPGGLTGYIQMPSFQHGALLFVRQLPFDEIGDPWLLDDPTLPLSVAALMGDLPTVELLVQNGVNPNALPWHNSPNPWLSVSPLSLAALTGHDDVVVYLLQHGAKTQFNDIACVMQGWPFASPSQETRENTVKLLIAAGALKNITEEQTAFVFASSFQNPEWNLGIVKLLLDAGLNPNARTSDFRFAGKTVIELTKKQVELETKYNPEWEKKYHFQRNTKPLLELLEKADGTSAPI